MGSVALYGRLPILSRLPINFNVGGDNTVIPADTNGNRIVVHRMWFVVGAAVNLTFKDNLPSPAAVPMGQNGALVFDATGEPWFTTDPNTAFIINASAGVQVSGEVFFILAK